MGWQDATPLDAPAAPTEPKKSGWRGAIPLDQPAQKAGWQSAIPLEAAAPQPSDISMGQAATVGALHTIPFADRAAAYLRAHKNDLGPIGAVIGGKGDQTYEQALTQQQDISEQAASQHPGAYMGGSLAGGFALPLPGVRLAGGLGRGVGA